MQALWWTYILLIHLALISIAIRYQIPTRIAQKLGLIPPAPDVIAWTHQFQAAKDALVPDGAVLFLGDSHTMTLAVSAVCPLSVNFGVSSQRTDHLLQSLPIYQSMSRARAVNIMIGTNDILQNRTDGIEDRYRAILDGIPSGVPVYLNSVPPLRDMDVRPVVEAARRACADRPNCTFIDLYAALTRDGKPIEGVLRRDGAHLEKPGYLIWIGALRASLK